MSNNILDNVLNNDKFKAILLFLVVIIGCIIVVFQVTKDPIFQSNSQNKSTASINNFESDEYKRAREQVKENMRKIVSERMPKLITLTKTLVGTDYTDRYLERVKEVNGEARWLAQGFEGQPDTALANVPEFTDTYIQAKGIYKMTYEMLSFDWSRVNDKTLTNAERFKFEAQLRQIMKDYEPETKIEIKL
jgi:hypothetical protein